MLSETLRNAIRTSGTRQWRLATVIGVHPSLLSNWMAGRYEPRRGDPRVLQLARLVGVPESEAFEQ